MLNLFFFFSSVVVELPTPVVESFLGCNMKGDQDVSMFRPVDAMSLVYMRYPNQTYSR